MLAIVQHRKGRSPGQRFRLEHYIDYFEKNGIEIDYSFIINEKDDKVFYSKGKYLLKLVILFKSFIHRLKDVYRAKDYDVIFIYREAFMLGTVFFEKMLAKTKVPIIFDFDDSIWLNDTSVGNKNLAWLKNPKKVASICKLSNLVTVGNEYLASYAKKYSQNVVVVPTTIDLKYHQGRQIEQGDKICIGWTGTSTTIKHFERIIPVLTRISKKYNDKVVFRVIADVVDLNYTLPVDYVKWSKFSEIDDLLGFDIGIMPLPDDEWSRGKCAFKGLQCMALKVPVILSPVGVNSEIIVHGENGFLADTDDEWFNYLSQLIEHSSLRNSIGHKGYETVKENFSVEVWEKKLFEIIVLTIKSSC